MKKLLTLMLALVSISTLAQTTVNLPAGYTPWTTQLYKNSGDSVIGGASGKKFIKLAQFSDLAGFVPTSRTVNGHALSSNVTVTKSDVGLGSVENTTLSTWAGSANITTLGTISTGVWHGTAITDTYISSASTWNGKQAALSGSGIVKSVSGTISYVTDNSSNWNTAYGWGDHAGLYSLLSHTHSFSSLTSKPTTVAGYGITDAQAILSGTGIVKSAAGTISYVTDNTSNWNTAFGWGNHASAGYSTSSNTQTFTNKTWNGVAIGDAYISSAATWNAKGNGTVTSVSVTSANGVSGSVATETTTPAITLTLGAIAPTSIATSGIIDAIKYRVASWETIDYTSSTLKFGGISGSQWTAIDFYANGTSRGVLNASGLALSVPIAATNFSGTSSGTNTGDQTNITGNAATATLAANSTLWGGASYGGPYLSLTGGTLSGSLTGTSATFRTAGEQLRLYYDASQYTSLSTASNGDSRLFSWNGSAYRPIYINYDGTTATGQAAVFGGGIITQGVMRVRYDASHTFDITPQSNGDVSLNAWNGSAYRPIYINYDSTTPTGATTYFGGPISGTSAAFSGRINGVVGGTAYNTAGLWLQGSGSTDGIAIGGIGGSYKTIDTYGGNLRLNTITSNGVDVGGPLAGTSGSYTSDLNTNTKLQIAAWDAISYTGNTLKVGGISASQYTALGLYASNAERVNISSSAATFNVPIVKSGGTSAQYLMADGSVSTGGAGSVSGGTLTFSGNGSTTDFNTSLQGSYLVITPTSGTAHGTYYLASITGCSGLCSQWHILYTSAPASGSNNISFNYLLYP